MVSSSVLISPLVNSQLCLTLFFIDNIEPVKTRPVSRAQRERPLASSAPAEPAVIHRSQTPAAEKHVPQPPPTDDDGLEPYDVATSRDIDDLVRDMLPWFDGKESEENWSKRENNVILLRRVTRGNAPNNFSQTFLAAIKTLLDGIFKVVHSLRTTMSTNGSMLIQDIARICGPKIDPMVEIIMQNLMKLCSALKKIAAQNGNATVDAVISNVSFNIRLLQHVAFAAQDKNFGVRLFAAGWMKTLIARQARHKSTIEHGGGLDLVEKSITKGLGDANPSVREAARGAFWTFYGVWPDRANSIADTLDSKSRNLLEKDSANPNTALKSPSALPAKSPAKSRSALQEAIAARKKAHLPSRPESAQPFFDDAKPSAPVSKSTRTVPTGAPLSSLSSAPMRPGMKPKRAELSRPATADPYARRPESRTQTTREGTTSPRTVRSKPSTPNPKLSSTSRPRQNEATHAATTKGRPKKLDLSKSKSHSDLAAANRARSDSTESVTHPPSARTPRYGSNLSPTATRHSPAPAALESPPFAASQPLLTTAPDGPHAGSVPLEYSEPEPMILEEPSEAPPVAVSPPRHTPEIAVGVPHSPERSRMSPAPVPESLVKSQPESMVIYEDPATPTAAEREDYDYGASVGRVTPSQTPSKTPAKSPSKSPFKSPIPHDQFPVEPTSPAISAPSIASAKKPIPELVPNQKHCMETGVRTPSPTRRAPLQSTPSPTRSLAYPVTSNILPDTTVPQENIVDYPVNDGNNENATPRLNKSVDFPLVPRSPVKQTALEEVTANENLRRCPEGKQQLPGSMSQSTSSQSLLSQSATSEDSSRRTRKWVDRHRSPSPRSKDPVNAKEMIHKGLERIISRTMEPSGYRKLQGLFQYHGEEIVAQIQDYNTMLEALLTELEAAPHTRKDHDVKTQVLVTIRSMLLRTREHFCPYDSRAMAALIRARQYYESSSHFVVGLEEAADKLVFLTTAQTAITGVLQALDVGNESEADETYRSTIMGLSTIQQSLTRPGIEISDELLASIGTIITQSLNHPRPGVRKNATELCTFLNINFGSERVQKITQPPREGSLNLLTYFMARRTQ